MSDPTPPPIPGAPPPAPAPPSASAPAKKGLSPWAWIAIGCGSLVVLGGIAFVALGVFVFRAGQEAVEEATGGRGLGEVLEDFRDNPARTGAELVIRANPDLEFISTDEAAGTITFRNTRTDEVATLNFEDIAEGRISMTTDDGEVSIDATQGADGAPSVTFSGPDGETRLGGAASLDEVPDWVPVYPGATDTQSAFQTTSGDTLAGAVTGTTTDTAQTVVEYYKSTLEDAGYVISTESLTRSGDGALGSVVAELEAEGRSITVAAMEQPDETQVMVNYTTRP